MVELETRFDSSRNMNGICFEDFDGDGSNAVTTPLIESGVEVNSESVDGHVAEMSRGIEADAPPPIGLDGKKRVIGLVVIVSRHLAAKISNLVGEISKFVIFERKVARITSTNTS